MDEQLRALLPAERPVTVLYDPTDDVAVTRGLLAAHAPKAGVVVVHPTAGTTAEASPGADVMTALGRWVTRLAAERISGPDAVWHAIAAWVNAERIDHLIVLRTNRLHVKQRERLLHLRWLTGVRLVLVWHAPAQRPARELDLIGIPHEVTTDLAGLLDELAAHPRPPVIANTADLGDLLAVSGSDFDTFRADAARELDRTSFGRVDAVYTDALQRTCRCLAEREWANPDDHEHPYVEVWQRRSPRVRAKARGHDIDPTWFGADACADNVDSLQAMLARLVSDSPGPNYTVAAVRGAQAALQLRGWRLELPNLAYAVGPGLTTTPMTTALVDRIRTRVPSEVPPEPWIVGYAAFAATVMRDRS